LKSAVQKIILVDKGNQALPLAWNEVEGGWLREEKIPDVSVMVSTCQRDQGRNSVDLRDVMALFLNPET
jgi:hypothetical protein